MATHIETERVILRDWKHEDLEHFTRINEDPLVMEYYPSRLSEEASAALMGHFQDHIDKKSYGFFAAEDKASGEFIGFAGIAAVPKAMPFSPAVELAWRLDYTFWGKGYAQEIAKALLDYARAEAGLKELVAYCIEDNIRAIPALEAIGFTEDKKAAFTHATKRKSEKAHLYKLFRLMLS